MIDIYAEEVGNYWKTGHSSPDVWIGRTTSQIEKAGGEVVQEAFGRVGEQAAFMMLFRVGDETYKVIWPVLRSKSGNDRAAKIQAATMLYHDVKARCVSAKVLGVRAAFFNYLLLPDGRTVGEMATPELMEHVPAMLKNATVPQIEAPIVEGEYEEYIDS